MKITVTWEVHNWDKDTKLPIVAWRTREQARSDMRTIKATGHKGVKMYKVTRIYIDGKIYSVGEQKR